MYHFYTKRDEQDNNNKRVSRSPVQPAGRHGVPLILILYIISRRQLFYVKKLNASTKNVIMLYTRLYKLRDYNIPITLDGAIF